MGKFNRDNNVGRGRGFGRQEFGNRGSDRPQMHKTMCSKCGKECEVPFRPTGSKPVFCRDCFRDNGGSEARSSGGDFRRSNFDEKQMYDAVCDSCGNTCKIPFQPRSGKPVYCSNCFEGKNENRGRNTEQNQYKEQFEALNTKLDKILKMLQPATPLEVTNIIAKEEVANTITDQPKKQTATTEKKTRVSKKTAATKE